MNINRYNYEEFFLLYADGELGPLETGMVNQFVQLHPDLKEELDILKDCKLVADMPIFPKEKLYKQTIWDADNINEMQTNLLLLVDGELTEKFKKELEKNIEENPALQQEWKTLQQAKLPIENILHPYKKPLFKENKVFKINWLRWAAAAAIIVGAGWILVGKSISGNPRVESLSIAKSEAFKQQKAVGSLPIIPKVAENHKENNTETAVAQNIITKNSNEKITKTLLNVSGHSFQKSVVKNADKEILEKVISTNNVQDIAINDNPILDDMDGRIPLITSKTNDNIEKFAAAKPIPVKLKAPKIGQIATLKSSKKLEDMADIQQNMEDNEYIRIAGARVKKQKIRGVFRGVFRGIGRTFSNSKVEAASAVAVNNE